MKPEHTLSCQVTKYLRMRGYITYILPLIILFIFGFGIYDKFFAK